jgi:hypothetical protein
VTRGATWPEPGPGFLAPRRATEVVGASLLGNPLLACTTLRLQFADPLWLATLGRPPVSAVKQAVFTTPPTPNAGGQAETEPAKGMSDAMRFIQDQ